MDDIIQRKRETKTNLTTPKLGKITKTSILASENRMTWQPKTLNMKLEHGHENMDQATDTDNPSRNKGKHTQYVRSE